jgi:IS30 family transposase
MSKNYTQLSLEQRYQIEALLKAGIKQKDIASQLGVHPSTISRELRRNTARRGQTSGGYQARNAQRRTILRHRSKPKQIRFTEEVKHQITKLLCEDKWSPEFISAMGKRSGAYQVSHEWIYHWIWSCKKSHKAQDRPFKQLYNYLRHGKRRRKRGNRKDRRGIIPNRVSIEKRPLVVNARERLGDLEVDLMLGKDHQGALLVMTDRSTLHTRIKKLLTKSSTEVTRAMIKSLKENKYQLHTLTFDNDMAFVEHQKIAAELRVDTYFTRPFTSQDKGTVENRIGVIRRFFPKKTDLAFVSEYEVMRVEQLLNNRPVRKFNYLSANQVLHQKIALIT